MGKDKMMITTAMAMAMALGTSALAFQNPPDGQAPPAGPQRQGRPGQQGPGAPIDLAQLATHAISRAADTDHSLGVSEAEWRAFLDSVSGTNGAVDPRALGEAMRKSGQVGMGGPGPGQRGGQAPPDREQRPPRDRERPDRGEMLAMIFDHNKDGAIEQDDLQAIFDEMDSDSNGAITGDEYPMTLFSPEMRTAARIAATADADGDKDVSDEEWRNLLASLKPVDGIVPNEGLMSLFRPQPRPIARPDASGTGGSPPPTERQRGDREGSGRMIVGAYDWDYDGKVEITDLQRFFDLLDVNRNGEIGASEFPEQMQRPLGPPPRGGG